MRKLFQNAFGIFLFLWGTIQKFGWPLMIVTNFPDFVSRVERFGSFLFDWALILLGIVLLISANWQSMKRRIWGEEKPKWVPLHHAIDYMNLKSKFTLPTRGKPMEASTFMSATVVQQAALDGRLKIKGRKKNTSDYEIIKSDYWRLAHFDWLGLMAPDRERVSKTDLYAETIKHDSPPVPAYMDLLVDIHELRNVFPSQNWWDRSKFGKWIRKIWVGEIVRRN